MSTGPAWMPPDTPRVNGVWQLGAVDEALSAHYETVRSREQRILADEVVRDLPGSGRRTAQALEWRVRARSLDRLLRALRGTGAPLRVLDIGCGNGWMSAAIAADGHSVVALDMHRLELEQAVRVFAGRDVTWCLGDPRAVPLPAGHFDVVIFAASLQYFDDLPALFDRMRKVLGPTGVVHVLDTVLYADRAAADAARERSLRYYLGIGAEGMAAYYHAHCLGDLVAQGPARILKAPDEAAGIRWPWTPRDPFHHVTIAASGPLQA